MSKRKVADDLDFELSRDPYVLCICEGTAEEAVMDILLDNDMLKLSRSQLINNHKVTRTRKARDIETQFLNIDYSDRGLIILRILDSKREKFLLRKQYSSYKIFNIYTRPEIEILHIIAEDCGNDFQKKTMKPSAYFKGISSVNTIKRASFIREYYSDPEKLLQAILQYHHHFGQKDELNLSNLLKK